MEKKWILLGSSVTSPSTNTDRKEVYLENTFYTENLILIGSENHYNSFWTKMMFIGAAYAFINNSALFRPAQKYTVLYVDNGYTHSEKLALDNLAKQPLFTVIKINSADDVVKYFNQRGDYMLQDVAFFSHGTNEGIHLNYKTRPHVDFSEDLLSNINPLVFAKKGRIFSYACRTGTSVDIWPFGFKDDSEAKPENSLAQKMANHFDVEVHAFLRRTDYSVVLRKKEESSKIASTLKKARESKEGAVIQIPTEHEALPHNGLGEGFLRDGAEKEGTNDYALWRKQGGLALPVAAETPKGLSTEMRIFKKEKR
jgi:hypothetical protein